jgi:hypothetical protein
MYENLPHFGSVWNEKRGKASEKARKWKQMAMKWGKMLDVFKRSEREAKLISRMFL